MGLLPSLLKTHNFVYFYLRFYLPFTMSLFFCRGSSRQYFSSLFSGFGWAELFSNLPTNEAKRFYLRGQSICLRMLAFFLLVSISFIFIERKAIQIAFQHIWIAFYYLIKSLALSPLL